MYDELMSVENLLSQAERLTEGACSILRRTGGDTKEDEMNLERNIRVLRRLRIKIAQTLGATA